MCFEGGCIVDFGFCGEVFGCMVVGWCQIELFLLESLIQDFCDWVLVQFNCVDDVDFS